MQNAKLKIISRSEILLRRTIQNSKFLYFHPTGFTLVEMLVAMGVFVTLVTVTLGIYGWVFRAQYKTTAFSEIQQEVQFALEKMVKKIKEGKIDYSYYGGPLSYPEDELAILETGESWVFKLDGNILKQSIQGAPFKPLTRSKTEILALDFYISPLENPFSPEVINSVQPRVTIVTKIMVQEKGEIARLIVQTTVPQRYTERP